MNPVCRPFSTVLAEYLGLHVEVLEAARALVEAMDRQAVDLLGSIQARRQAAMDRIDLLAPWVTPIPDDVRDEILALLTEARRVDAHAAKRLASARHDARWWHDCAWIGENPTPTDVAGYLDCSG